MSKQPQTSLHPIVNYLKSRIESLLTLIQFEQEGQPIEPDTFRLRNLSGWSFERYNSIFDSLGSFSGYCNLRCKFCYEDGNPLPYEKSRLSIQEARTRIRYYRPEEHRGLPLFKRRLYKEPFTNRDIISILEMVRGSNSDAEISLTTNGSMITEKTLGQLAQLKPINLSISVNSSDPLRRRELMGDRNSETSLKIIKKFKEYGLPFCGSIVAWPTIKTNELIETIHFLDDNFARMIRVTLPGYSKFYSQTSQFNTKEVWNEVLKTVRSLRKKIKTPLFILPSLYHTEAFLPKIDGIIRNSPAYRSGLQSGDIIREINGKSMSFRSEAKEFLTQQSNCSSIKICFERRGQVFSVELHEKEGNSENYPYRPQGYPASQSQPFGIVLIDDFNPNWLWRILQSIRDEIKAKHILLMTSDIMEPLVAHLLEIHPSIEELLKDINLYIWTPQHRFWGGNIIMGDLYTCSDYLHAVYDFQEKQGIKPDFIIIPSSFSYNSNVDLLGVSYSSIEYATGIPVKLAKCSHITL